MKCTLYINIVVLNALISNVRVLFRKCCFAAIETKKNIRLEIIIVLNTL